MNIPKTAYLVQFSSRAAVEAIDDRRHEGLFSRGQIAARDLGRYYALLAREMATLQFGEGEAYLICDALNGTILDETSIRLIWAEVEDAIRLDGLDHKWNVDGGALVEKLKSLCPGQAVALVDAVERAWMAPNEPDRLQTVGLVRKEH